MKFALPSARILLGAAFLFVVPTGAPFAADCDGAAVRAAASYGADRVIKVRQKKVGGSVVCEITLRIPGARGELPRVETMQVDG